MEYLKKELIEMITELTDKDTLEYLHEYTKLTIEMQEV